MFIHREAFSFYRPGRRITTPTARQAGGLLFSGRVAGVSSARPRGGWGSAALCPSHTVRSGLVRSREGPGPADPTVTARHPGRTRAAGWLGSRPRDPGPRPPRRGARTRPGVRRHGTESWNKLTAKRWDGRCLGATAGADPPCSGQILQHNPGIMGRNHGLLSTRDEFSHLNLTALFQLSMIDHQDEPNEGFIRFKVKIFIEIGVRRHVIPGCARGHSRHPVAQGSPPPIAP